MNAAEKLNGNTWQLAKLAAFLCFVVAGGFMLSSLLSKDHAVSSIGGPSHSTGFVFPTSTPRG